MRRTRAFVADSQYKEEIRRLEDDLYLARRTIIGLMPDNVQEIMSGYYSCRSREELCRWEHETVDQIIELASIPSAKDGSCFSDRAYCPLCGQGSSSPYERGFSVPEGLRRHLAGWGNVRQCGVVEAAMSLARGYWEREYSSAEKAEEAERREKLAQRKNSEMLYRTAPDLEPVLIDEGMLFGGAPRSEEQLDWIEERLASLGFRSACEGNAKSYTNEHGNYVVYADPRQSGKVEFSVFPKNHKRLRSGLLRRPVSFYMLDGWKNELREKYEARVQDAISQLEKRP